VVIGWAKKEAGPLNEMFRIKFLNEFFTLEGKARKHSLKLTKFRCIGDSLGVFFQIQLSHGNGSAVVDASSSNGFRQGKLGWYQAY